MIGKVDNGLFTVSKGKGNILPPSTYLDGSYITAHGNDWTILRDELNLGASTNLASEDIFYKKINGNDSRFSFDIPSGNKGGAIVGEWIPGVYTRNGTAEAALIGSDDIVHNKNINQLLNNFSGMWEKIR